MPPIDFKREQQQKKQKYSRPTYKAPKPFSRPADVTPVAVVKPKYRGTPAAARGAPAAHVSSTSKAYYPKPARRGPSTLQKVTRQARRRIRRQAEDRKTQTQIQHTRKLIRKVDRQTPADHLGAALAVKYGKKTGVPPSLLAGLQEQESGFNPEAVSSASAFGRTQFIPSTAAIYGVKPGSSKKAQKSQVKGAARYLRDLGVKKDPHKALGGYYGSATETLASGKTYPEEVLEKSNKYRKLDKAAPKVGKLPVPQQRPGAWGGSKRYANQVIPKGITPTSTKRTPESNASVGGSTSSDHLTTSKSAWAYDFADDPKISSAIARNLGIKGFKHGQNTTVYRDGYRIQLLTAPHGTGPHVHLGIKWEGSSAVGGPITSGVAGAVATSAVGRPGPGGRAGALSRRRRRGAFPRGKTLQEYLEGLDVKGEKAKPVKIDAEKLREIQEKRKAEARKTKVSL